MASDACGVAAVECGGVTLFAGDAGACGEIDNLVSAESFAWWASTGDSILSESFDVRPIQNNTAS